FTVHDSDMKAFQRISGDTNPLHHDADFAARRGFPGVVVYGGLILAQVSRLLGTELPGYGCVWRAVTLRFRSPLFVDEQAELSATVIHANDELGTFELKLSVTAAGRRIAEGEASAQQACEREDLHA